MQPRTHLLFLYMVSHTGHQKAAESVIEAARRMDPNCQCTNIDAVSHAYPLIGNVVNRMYIQLLKRMPFVWDYLYDNPDVEEATREARSILTHLSIFQAKKILRRFNPSALICTQAVPAIAYAAARRKGHLNIPLIGIITDFSVHSYWLHKEVDLYLVGHDDVKHELIARGIDERKIQVTGIPIDPKFGESLNRMEEKKFFRLDPHRQTILLMGGSRGFGSLEDTVKTLDELPIRHQLVVVCGKNKRLFNKLSRLSRHKNHMQVFGYVKDIHRLMTASDILISKPGGLTCSEALAMQIPMVLINPIPGQEERNVKFLLKHRVARIARTSEDLHKNLLDLIRHPHKLQQMRLAASQLSKPHAAWEAAHQVFNQIHHSPKTLGRAGE